MLSASVVDHTPAWYEDMGAGSFGPQQVINSVLNGDSSIAMHSTDMDGDVEVLSASDTDNTVPWYEHQLEDPFASYCSGITCPAVTKGTRDSAVPIPVAAAQRWRATARIVCRQMTLSSPRAV